MGKKCKHALGCHSYKCPFEHPTVTGYSKKAEEILQKVREENKIKAEEEKNNKIFVAPKVKKQDNDLDNINKRIADLQKLMEDLNLDRKKK